MIECPICKAKNELRSLYCVECGQRLVPLMSQSNNPSATADILPATSPPLTNAQGTNAPLTNAPATRAPRGPLPNPSLSGRLRSPILDIDPEDESPAEKGNKLFNRKDFTAPTERAEANRAHSLSRAGLHSPLLDAQEHDASDFGSEYVEETYIEEEYESLRSPLLKAKVPLPDKKAKAESISLPSPSPQSILGASNNANAQSNLPAVTNYKAQKAGNQFGWDSETAAQSTAGSTLPEKVQERTEMEKSRTPLRQESAAFLPKNELTADLSNIHKSKSTFNKAMITLLVVAALGLKIWYLSSLGNTLFASSAFAFDQGGQILTLIVLLILALS